MYQAPTPVSGLFTDFYELTMMQAYFQHGMHTTKAVFEMFFRSLPFNGGYAVFAGLDDLLSLVEEFRFSDDDINYLAESGMFFSSFLEYLRSFSFRGTIYAIAEGKLCFPLEPIVRVHANIAEAQIIESIVLNTLNFQTLIATKSARIYHASGQGKIMEFGLRRAHGINGALSASRAAYIGGVVTTSNVMAGKHYGIPVTGTMAHSWIMAHDSEEEAFARYAELYPDSCTFLLDTYNTLESGLPNAITVGKKLKQQGKTFGVRLDSGDIEYLSKQVRNILDNAGLHEASIAVSNELNEYIIQQLVASDCPIDYWGVGSDLVCGPQDAMLNGVYKLVALERAGQMRSAIKLSDHPHKSSMPGIKQVYRLYSREGMADLITLDNEDPPVPPELALYHPAADYRHFTLDKIEAVDPLLQAVMINGKRQRDAIALVGIQDCMRNSMRELDSTYKRILNPHVYKVSISRRLWEEKTWMIKEQNK